VWDRARQDVLAEQRAESATEIEAAEASLRVAEQRAAENPNDPTTKAILVRAQQMLDHARARADQLRAAADAAQLPPLEKAAYLGIATSPAPPVLRKQLKLSDGMGLVVDFVEPGSPAEAAGVQPYDVAVRLNDQILVNAPQLAVLVRTFDPGAEVTLTVIREGKETPVKVKLVEREVKPIADTAFGPVSVTANNPLARMPFLAPMFTRDHTIRPGDVIDVTIYDLEGPGLETNVKKVVSKDGRVSLPYVKEPLTVRGLTEVQCQSSISDAYAKAGVLESANVSVNVVPADEPKPMNLPVGRTAPRRALAPAEAK
jgi:hypothetical protein